MDYIWFAKGIDIIEIEIRMITFFGVFSPLPKSKEDLNTKKKRDWVWRNLGNLYFLIKLKWEWDLPPNEIRVTRSHFDFRVQLVLARYTSKIYLKIEA